jgi:hypothetical protein
MSPVIPRSLALPGDEESAGAGAETADSSGPVHPKSLGMTSGVASKSLGLTSGWLEALGTTGDKDVAIDF